MPIDRYFKLYLNAGRSIPLVINANQYDSGETWHFTLYTDRGEVYLPSSGAIIGIKADGHIIDNAATVDSRGRVVVTETEQMTAAAGKAVFEISIDDNSHGSANFIVLVEPKPSDGGVLSDSDLSLIQEAIDNTSPAAIAQGVSDWMDEHLTPTTPVVDDTLTVQGAAADAKKTGDEIADLKSAISQMSGLSEDVKVALLQIAQKVAYIDEDGQDYYDDLYDALYPPATLSSITCVYTQSGTVYDNASLDSLKTDLVVTAHWDDNTTSTVASADYTLSGTLTTGTSTITVTYSGKTTTFTVTVTHATTQYTITNTLAHVTNSNNATVINEQTAYSATLSAESGYVISSVTVTMGGTDITSTAYSNGTVSIASVTGDIVITASAIVHVTVKTVTGVTPLISIGDITLTPGMINDSGEIVSQSNSYVYDEFVPGNAWITLNSSYALKDINHRTAGYDSSKSFLGRNYKNGGGFYEGASFVKMGYTGSVDSTCYLLNLPYLLSNICTIEGVRISNTGEEQTESGYYSSDFIPIQTTGVGALSSISGTSKVTGIAFYDSSKTFISYAQATSISSNKNFVAPFEITSNMKYCRITTAYPAKSAISLVIEEV